MNSIFHIFIPPIINSNIPRYKSTKGALVIIKDTTNYKELQDALTFGNNFDFTFRDFELLVGDYIEFEVEEFWDFIKRLKPAELGTYKFIINKL